MRVWHFCEGWRPDIVPLAATYYGVRDVGVLMDHLVILRDTLNRRKALEQKARGR